MGESPNSIPPEALQWPPVVRRFLPVSERFEGGIGVAYARLISRFPLCWKDAGDSDIIVALSDAHFISCVAEFLHHAFVKRDGDSSSGCAAGYLALISTDAARKLFTESLANQVSLSLCIEMAQGHLRTLLERLSGMQDKETMSWFMFEQVTHGLLWKHQANGSFAAQIKLLTAEVGRIFARAGAELGPAEHLLLNCAAVTAAGRMQDDFFAFLEALRDAG